MKKIAQGIVRLRKLILTVAFLLLIPSAIGAIATRINYDILTYLPQDLDSMIGEVALEDDFHLASTGMITVEGLPTNELIAMKKDIEAVPGVTQTFWLSDVIDPSIPTEMLPADVQQFMFGKNDSTMLIVRFDAPSASDETMEAVAQIEKLLRKDCFFGGMSVILQDTKALVNQEMPMYILIAVGASLLVLFLSLESTITPLLFMLGLLFPIAYNFGTNIFLGQISYITEALATVLQLGVTMDFSIFLLHRYQEEKELRSSNEEAMTSAICKTMTSISASSLTTIAGFLALCAMRLTLGRDIGLVMAKGVALGVICTVVILPSLILTFDKWVEKYKHRTVIPKLKKLSYFVSNHSVPIVVIFILILIPFAIAQNKTEVYYTLFDSLPQDLSGIVGTNKLGEDFGMTTSHFILVHDDLTATEVSDLCDELKDVDGITQVVSLDSITGPGFQTELLPDSIMEILQSGGYKLILANSSYKTGTDAINIQLAVFAVAADELSGGVGRADGTDLALLLELHHGLDGLFQREDGKVRRLPVGVEHVQMVGAETAQAVFHILDDALGRQVAVGLHAVHHLVENGAFVPPLEAALGGEDDLVPVDVAQGFAHHLFAVVKAVDGGGVYPGDALLHGSLDGFYRQGVVVVAPPAATADGPGAKPQKWCGEAAFANVTFFHRSLPSFPAAPREGGCCR